MIFTDLTYTEVGGILATFSLLFFAGVVLFRGILAFRNYIQTGKFGDFTKSFFGEAIDNGNFFSPYAFTGYHPGILIIDALMFALVSILMIPLWAAFIVLGLFLLLGRTMRKRIAIKQAFVGNLKGDQLDEETE